MASCNKCGRVKLRKASNGIRKCARCGFGPTRYHTTRSATPRCIPANDDTPSELNQERRA